MIADLKPYAEYKESGFPWLGRVPAHWDKRRMKFLFKERVQKGFPSEPLLAATQSKGVVQKADYGTRTVTASKDFHLLKLVEKGDFVISLRSFQGGIEESHCRGIISPAYTVLSPKPEAGQGYYARFFKSIDFINSLTLFVTGIREGQNIDYERLSRAYMPLPPTEEQAAIGKFLDWANGRLDRAIRAKRKVITLLNEQKQAIIHRAVTRGLDPSVPLKPSGIPWLDDVPAHWTVMPLKHAFTSMDYGISDPTFDAGSIRVLGMGQIKDGEITVPEDGGVNTVDPLLFLKDGDLLFNRTNSAALVGKVGVFRGHNTAVTFASYLVRLRPKSGFDSEYLNFVLNCSVILNVARQSSIPSLHQSNLNPARYGRLAIAVPGLEEQQQILRHLIAKCQPLNDAIRKADQTAQRIAEYRTRLVADVVTGKLDVREAAAKLPVEELANQPEDELVDEASEAIEDEMAEPVA
jgi:type I restriction enzyme, S subunit